jgi:serine/threonine-protein kinase
LRYRPLRFHAEGGLGEVQVAFDEELHREVALKRMQRQYAQDAASRRRFLREAEITGRLEHPGVVPVHGLMQDSDGQPCYAMRFIQGETLKQAIQRFHAAESVARDPGERSLALRQLLSRFLAVCNTVAYAHSRGILHRDLKPSNIMLGKYGETLVVDWGLAKPFPRDAATLQVDEETFQPASGVGATGTQVGQVVGTPAYMSPEQTAGRWDVVSPASDIYSLGATLYVLLTSQTPFPQAAGEDIFHKIQRGACRPPRQVNPRTPPALDAICRKAMALRPEDRYPTPLALAAEVEHWLADEPVAAYREPWADRLRRWGRRHRPVMASAVALLVTAVLALAIGIYVVNGEKQRTDKALVAESQAKRRTRQALDAMSSQVIEKLLSKQGRKLEPAQQEFLEDALAYYREFAREAGDSMEVRQGVANAHRRVGDICNRLGQHETAQAAYRHAREAGKQLVADFPTVPQFRQELASSHNSLGILLKDMVRFEDAEAAFRDALTLQKQLVVDFPTLPEYRRDLASSYNNLGNLLGATRRSKEAETAYRNALTLREQLTTDSPTVPQFRQELASSHYNLGMLLEYTGRSKEAETAYRDALTLQKQLVVDFPTESAYHGGLVLSHNSLGNLLKAMRRYKEAETAYRDALTAVKQLAADFPTLPQYRRDLAGSHNNLGTLLVATRRYEEAETAFRDAVQLQEQLIADFPKVPDYRQDLVGTYYNLSVLMQNTGRLKGQEEAYRKNLALEKQLAADFPKVPEYRRYLATSHTNLGILLADTGRPQEAEAAYRDALAIRKQLVADFPKVSEYRGEWAASYTNLGILLKRTSRPQEAEAADRDALAIRKQLIADLPKVPAYQHALATTMVTLANLLRERREFVEARELLDNAELYHQAALKARPADPTYRRLYRKNRWVLAVTLAGLGEHATAAKTAEQVAQLGWDPAEESYDAACALAQCVSLAEKDAKLTTAERPQQVRAYADRALELLRQAVANGYKNAARMKQDPDLQPLHARPEFQHLLATLEARVKVDKEWRACVNRAMALLNKGEHEKAITEVAPVAKASPVSPDVLYDAACVYSLCSVAARQDVQLPPADQEQRIEEYAHRAIALLRRAVQAGFNDLPHLKTNDPDLAPLRGRTDFQQLVQELEAKTKAGAK